MGGGVAAEDHSMYHGTIVCQWQQRPPASGSEARSRGDAGGYTVIAAEVSRTLAGGRDRENAASSGSVPIQNLRTDTKLI